MAVQECSEEQLMSGLHLPKEACPSSPTLPLDGIYVSSLRCSRRVPLGPFVLSAAHKCACI